MKLLKQIPPKGKAPAAPLAPPPQRGMRLFEISQAMRQTMEAILANDFASPADRENAFAELGALDGKLADKVHATMCVALELQATVKARDEVILRMEEANIRDMKRHALLTEYVTGAMVASGHVGGKRELAFPEFCVVVSLNPGSVDVTDISQLSDEYKRVVPAVPAKIEADKKKLLAALRDGEIIPGAALKRDYKLDIK